MNNCLILIITRESYYIIDEEMVQEPRQISQGPTDRQEFGPQILNLPS